MTNFPINTQSLQLKLSGLQKMQLNKMQQKHREEEKNAVKIISFLLKSINYLLRHWWSLTQLTIRETRFALGL